MAIEVSEAYLRRLINVLNGEIAGGVAASPRGPINTVAPKAGYAIRPGEALEETARQRGSDVHGRLRELGNLANTRASQLFTFIAMTNRSEDFSRMSALDIQRRLPSWVTGGPARTGPTTT